MKNTDLVIHDLAKHLTNMSFIMETISQEHLSHTSSELKSELLLLENELNKAIRVFRNKNH